MPIVRPPSARYTTEDLGSSLRITVPGRKNWIAAVILSYWLIIWAFGAITFGGLAAVALFSMLMGKASSASAADLGSIAGDIFSLLAWIGMWIASGAFVIYGWLWQVVGKEVIEASGHSITIRKVVLGFSRPKEYLVEHVKDLRAVPNITAQHWIE